MTSRNVRGDIHSVSHPTIVALSLHQSSIIVLQGQCHTYPGTTSPLLAKFNILGHFTGEQVTYHLNPHLLISEEMKNNEKLCQG